MKRVKVIFLLVFIIIFSIVLFVTYSQYVKKWPSKEILDEGVLLIYPKMTEIAYAKDSFYDYYFGRCDESCLTKSLDTNSPVRYVLGKNGFDILAHNYNSIDDLHLDSINLRNYHTIILFHNEYVTQSVFDKITNFSNVVYLYPNALYALVDVDYHAGTMTLIKGHGYPSPELGNGFNWKDDNSRQEIDCKIGEWKFNKVSNGIMLDCYPEQIMRNDTSLKNYIDKYVKEHKLN